jgi:hypothetical protein
MIFKRPTGILGVTRFGLRFTWWISGDTSDIGGWESCNGRELEGIR